jgi:hypothetical protein
MIPTGINANEIERMKMMNTAFAEFSLVFSLIEIGKG